MKRKLMPPFMMLFAGAIASIIMYINHYEIKTMLWILIAVFILFYIIGVIIKKTLDSFYSELNKINSVADEGEVIEKEKTEDSTAQVEEEQGNTEEE